MTFSSTHIPANLTKLVFTGPSIYVPVNLGVDENAEVPELCLDLWQPQKSSNLKLIFAEKWEDQSPTKLKFVWMCPVEECIGLWEWTPGNEVNFDNWFKRVPVNGDEVDFNFVCGTTPSVCNTLWVDYQGNSVPVAFTSPWTEYQGNQVPIAFECKSDGGGGGDEFTFFSGYIDNYTGEHANLDFQQTLIFNSYEGQYIGGLSCGVAIPASIVNAGSSGALVDPIGDRAILQILNNGSSGNTGANASHNIRVRRESEYLEFSWKQTHQGSWYDNDDTDAAVYFNLIDAPTVSALVTPTGTWTYRNFNQIAGFPIFTVYFPFDTTSTGRISYKTAAQSSPGVGLNFSFDPFNAYDGTKTIRLRLSAVNTTTTRIEIWADDVQIANQTIAAPTPTGVIPVWHYHNYNNFNSRYEVSDIQITGCDEFLTVYPQIGIPVFAYTGETTAINIATTDALSPLAHVGESAVAQLATTTTFEFSAYEGQHLLTDLTIPQPATFDLNVFDGSYSTASVATTANISDILFYFGEYSDLDIAIFPAPEINFNFYTGEWATASLQVSIALGSVNGYTGEWATIQSMDTAENYANYTGETLVVDLATDTTLPAVGYTGESASTILEIRPSEGMGTFVAYSGESGDVVVTTLVQVLLYPNVISARDGFYCEFDSNSHFDLLQTSCCPKLDTHARIELNDGPRPDERYDGDKTIVQMELSTLPRFTFNFYQGEETKLIDPNYLGVFNAYEGHAPLVYDLDSEFINIRLCYGNFIPDGNNVFIELMSEYAEDCASDIIFTGEEVSFELNNTIGPEPRAHAGEWMAFDLFIDPLMLLRAYSGEMARISNPEFEPRVGAGESASFQFEEFNWYAYAGESMMLDTLTTEYDVEFLEQGCLDNEFVPSNENGDPDWDKFNEVPVELEFYAHSIQARCF